MSTGFPGFPSEGIGFLRGVARNNNRESQFVLYVELPIDLATGPELYVEIQKHFRALVPFLEFLNAPLVSSRNKPNERT